MTGRFGWALFVGGVAAAVGCGGAAGDGDGASAGAAAAAGAGAGGRAAGQAGTQAGGAGSDAAHTAGTAGASDQAGGGSSGTTGRIGGAGGAGSSATAGSGGAAGAAGAAGAGGAAGNAVAFDPGWVDCEPGDRCVVVRSWGCCGCHDMAVNAAHESEAKAALPQTPPTGCPPLGCAFPGCVRDARAVCAGGACVVTPGCSQITDAAECAADGECQAYDARWCGNTAVWSVCAERAASSTCPAAPACRVHPDTAQMVELTSCVPPSWDQPCPVACP